MSCGILLVDQSGHVHSVNDRARSMLRNGLHLANGCLSATDPDGAAALRLALRQTFDLGRGRKPTSSFLIPRGGQYSPYVLHTYKLAAPVSRGKVTAMAIAILIDPVDDQSVAADWLAGVLNLPPGEARVATEIANGRTPRVAAQNLGLTEDSVRVILKRVYSKVNVSRQSELVLLVARFGNCTPDT